MITWLHDLNQTCQQEPGMQLYYASAGTVSVLSFSLQLSVKTRSVGTNTQEAEKAFESSYMEPCQPGTSVNLEGIVWHETEEGERLWFCAMLHSYKTVHVLSVSTISASTHWFMWRVKGEFCQDCVFKAAVRLKRLKEEETLVAYWLSKLKLQTTILTSITAIEHVKTLTCAYT